MSSTTASGHVDRRKGARARMPGPSAWFVAVCMVLIAGSLSAVIYLRFDASLAEAGWIGFAVLMIMVLAEFFAARRREQVAVEAQLAEVEAIAGQLVHEVVRIERQFGELEAALLRRVDDGLDTRLSGISGDLQAIEGELGRLDERLLELEQAREREAAAAPQAPMKGAAQEPVRQVESLDTIRRAIADNRIEVYLQPIVQLPQRKVRYYEALARLRGEDGRLILPAEFIPAAEPAGLMPAIDNIVTYRSVQILRRMIRRSPDLSIFCNLSARSLADGEFFPQFVDFMEANRELSGALVFELPQAVLDGLGPIEQTGMETLAGLGFRFSVDAVDRFDIDGAAYAAKKVRFVKIDAPTLLHPPPDAPIHAVDLAKLLARSGIELVASRIETEAELVDLLDFDIGLGQGHLFSPPRAVRSEILGDGVSRAPRSRAS